MTKYLEKYREIAKNLYPNSLTNSGISPGAITVAERRLGFLFPKALAEFYLLVGNHRSINFSYNELISIDCIEIEANKLVFFQENQGVCYWGIDLTDITTGDPPVWVGQSIENQEELDWYLDSKSLSDFLIIMLCWQSVMGGLPVVGSMDNVEKSIIKDVADNFSLIEVEENNSGLQAYIGSGKIVCLAKGFNEISLCAGAIDNEKFLEIENTLQIEWDYCSLDD